MEEKGYDPKGRGRGEDGRYVCLVPAGGNLYHVDDRYDLQQVFLAHQELTQRLGKRDSLNESSISSYDRQSRFRHSSARWKRTRPHQRRLDTWGVPFKAILDLVRRTRAVELLRVGQTSMTDIALLLGYSENAHFTRAFRRWIGMSPRQYANSAH